MSKPVLRAAILIVSTTASENPSSDAAEQTLRSAFEKEGAGQWDVVESSIVPDETTRIQRQVISWSDIPDGMNLIVTTGGTGFAAADHTPEVNMIFDLTRVRKAWENSVGSWLTPEY